MTLKPGRDGELGKCKRFKFISVHQDLSIRICGFHLGVSWLFPGVRPVLIFIGGLHLQENILYASGYKT